MSLFKKVSMKNVEKYVQVPEALKRMQCQVNFYPQFYEGKGSIQRVKGMSYPVIIGVDMGGQGGDKTIIRKKEGLKNDAI